MSFTPRAVVFIGLELSPRLWIVAESAEDERRLQLWLSSATARARLIEEFAAALGEFEEELAA